MINSRVQDVGFNILTTEADEIHICSQEPTTFAEVSTYSLGIKTTPTITIETVSTFLQAKVTPFSDGTINQTGDATHLAVVDTQNSRLLLVGTLTLQNVTIGLKFGFTDLTLIQTGEVSGILNVHDVGVNVSEVNYYSTDQPFVNRFYHAEEWLVSDYPNSGNWDNSATVPFTVRPDGYPTHVPFDAPVETGLPPQMVKVLIYRGEAPYPTGDYTLIFEGTGEVRLAYGATGSFTQSDTPHIVNVPISEPSGILVTIVESDVSDPIRNIRFILPGYADKYETQMFTDEFKALLNPFTTLRYMDWGAINDSLQVTADDLPIPTYYSQATDKGTTIEAMCTLSNETQKHAWICIPHKADDGMITAIAQKIKDTLDPNLKCYIEYSNEIWNGGFDQADWCGAEGAYLDPTADIYRSALMWQAKRSGEVWEIFNTVFGAESDRIIKTLASKFNSTSTPNNLINYLNDPSKNATGILPEVMADGVYFGGYDEGDKIADEGLVYTITTEEILQRVDDTFPIVFDRIDEHKLLCDQNNLKYIAYEGGQHLIATGPNVANEDLIARLLEANRHPGMGTLYTKLHNYWKDAGGGMFCSFQLCKAPNEFGSWGLLEYQLQDINTAYKYKAILDLEG